MILQYVSKLFSTLKICSYPLIQCVSFFLSRLYRFSGNQTRRIFKRWFTFKNIYILTTDVVFLIAFILRCVAYFNNQCRQDCPYEGNEIAFVAGAIWSFAALLAFLRIIQSNLIFYPPFLKCPVLCQQGIR